MKKELTAELNLENKATSSHFSNTLFTTRSTNTNATVKTLLRAKSRAPIDPKPTYAP